MPSPDRGLLARLDTLVELVADRHGLALLPDGRLAAAEARVAARATGLTAPRGSGGPAPGVTQREAVELLRAVAEGVGLLRVRADRLEATSLRHAWAQIDRGLRSGLVYAAWCHRVPWPAFLRGGTGVEALVGGRLWVLRLLLGLPAGVEVGLQGRPRSRRRTHRRPPTRASTPGPPRRNAGHGTRWHQAANVSAGRQPHCNPHTALRSSASHGLVDPDPLTARTNRPLKDGPLRA